LILAETIRYWQANNW